MTSAIELSLTQIHDILAARFGDAVGGVRQTTGDPWIEVDCAAIAEVCQFCKESPELGFQMLCNLCGVDYLETDPKRAGKATYTPHVEVVYHLQNLRSRKQLVLKVLLPRWKNDEPGQLPEVPSVAGVWAIANWHEREAYDLCGIRFMGHPQLERILCPDDWVGHPLRKDYEMPLEYQGIRGR